VKALTTRKRKKIEKRTKKFDTRVNHRRSVANIMIRGKPCVHRQWFSSPASPQFFSSSSSNSILSLLRHSILFVKPPSPFHLKPSIFHQKSIKFLPFLLIFFTLTAYLPLFFTFKPSFSPIFPSHTHNFHNSKF